MTEELTIPLAPLLLALRAVLRAVTLLAFAPWPSGRAVPMHSRLALALFLGPLLWLPAAGHEGVIPPTPEAFVLHLAGDALLGAGVGLTMRIVLAGATAAAAITGLQMGLTLSAVADPETGQRQEPIGRAYGWLAIALGIAMGLHRQVLVVFGELFQLQVHPRIAGLHDVALLGATVFTLGLRLAAPVAACLLLTDLVIGITGRLVPEVKAIVVAHAMKLLAGLVLIVLAIPVTSEVLMGEVFSVVDTWRLLVGEP